MTYERGVSEGGPDVSVLVELTVLSELWKKQTPQLTLGYSPTSENKLLGSLFLGMRLQTDTDISAEALTARGFSPAPDFHGAEAAPELT